MEEEDLEALLEEESRRKEQEDTQQVHQLLEENHTQRDGYSTESVGVQEEDDELEALLEQELQQKEKRKTNKVNCQLPPQVLKRQVCRMTREQLRTWRHPLLTQLFFKWKSVQ